jgi:butyrate kinase
LPADSRTVLVINPGSTSTKFGVFTPAGPEWAHTILHGDLELEEFRGSSALAQADFRAGLIAAALKGAGIDAGAFAGVAGRGGFLPPLPCGTYLVDEAMIEELRRALRGDHASNLGAPLALRFAQVAGVNAYIVDPVTADEWQPCARISGSPLVGRSAVGHVLNTKAVARRYAMQRGCAYRDLRLIVIHLGSGITVSAHRNGRIIDNNTPEEGPLGPDRSGSLPVRELIKACYSGDFSYKQLDRKVFGEGGLFAYLGTRDLRQVERRIAAGDGQANAMYEAMVYQIAKEAGAMSAVLQGRVDALLLTGGMAHSARLVDDLSAYIDWIAPIAVFPGEDELRALAEGVFRVLDGEERARRLWEEGRAPELEKSREALVIGLD